MCILASEQQASQMSTKMEDLVIQNVPIPISTFKAKINSLQTGYVKMTYHKTLNTCLLTSWPNYYMNFMGKCSLKPVKSTASQE